MIFSFIKYTQPGWQFNIKPSKAKVHSTCLYHPELLPLKDGEEQEDVAFETVAGRNADIGYRAWNKGYLIWADANTEEKIRALPRPSVTDEYTFVSKYWGRHWAAFALLRRLISFHNPFNEIKCFLKTSKVVRHNPYTNPITHGDYKNFKSPLLFQQPLVAVIIPTLNRYKYLEDVMKDLEKQDYKNFEVIVVDQSNPFDEAFYKQFHCRTTLIHQKERLLWTARNNAVKATKADYLLFFDDDSRVEPDWISQHIKCLDYFQSDISAGVSLSIIGRKVPQSYSYFRWADQFDSGNAMVKRAVFKSIGLFDEQYNKQRMGDGEFGIRAFINGYRSISNPFAARVHLKVADGGLREMGSWDAFRPKKWFAPRPIPSVVFLYKKYYPKTLYRSMMLLAMMISNVHFKNKGSNKMLVWSIFLSIIKAPLLIIQFLKARSIANKMLAKDDGIKLLAD